jgi:FKBP-type peptidyl-prolyl cis-trans isomerase
VKTEEQHIRDLIARYGWEMEETGTGLRYMIYEKGEGPSIVTGDVVELEYEVRLITGDRIYSSDEKGNMVFRVGKAEVISGLEQGILLLKVGDKAKFVIPSHLAYGLLGDDNKIPTKATLIYDIQVIRKK